MDTIQPNLPYGGQHLLIPDQLGTYEYVVTMVDSTPMTNNGQPQLTFVMIL